MRLCAYVCVFVQLRERTLARKKNRRREGLARKERGGEKGEGVIFIVRM